MEQIFDKSQVKIRHEFDNHYLSSKNAVNKQVLVLHVMSKINETKYVIGNLFGYCVQALKYRFVVG